MKWDETVPHMILPILHVKRSKTVKQTNIGRTTKSGLADQHSQVKTEDLELKINFTIIKEDKCGRVTIIATQKKLTLATVILLQS